MFEQVGKLKKKKLSVVNSSHNQKVKANNSFMQIDNKNEKKLMQRKVANWPDVQVAEGTFVYHCCNWKSAKSIIDDHIRDVENGWGGGALGPGFYTHKTPEGSANYVADGQRNVILKFKTCRLANGQSVRPSVYADKIGVQSGEDPLANNDFLLNAEDENEIKWHGGDALTFEGFSVCPEINKFYSDENDMEGDLYFSLTQMAKARN
ncbi:hypothetical protein ACP3V5_06075 [Vibrio maritimus]